jgi:SRSO17 transposase
MMSAVTEADLTAWAAELDAVLARTDGLFTRPEPRVRFADFVRGLLSPVERKNGWQLAERAGHSTPDAQQWLLNGASWSADALRDLVREYVVETLGGEGCGLRVFITDDTAAIKKGAMSVGVARQYAGITGQVENCQVMPMLTYATDRGHAFIDRRLYLPEAWTSDRPRCAQAGVPAEVEFATKATLAGQMLTAALDAGVAVDWFAADSGYGRDRALRQVCHNRHLPYVVEVPVNETVTTPRGAKTAGDFLARTATRDWRRYSGGHGAKGERYYDWAFHGDVDPGGQTAAPGFRFTLLIRRSVTDPDEVAHFLAHHPRRTAMTRLVEVAGMRWRIEENNEQAKSDIGLDHYEVRKWTPWHRHVTGCMLALAFLAAIRAGEAGKDPTPAETTS